MAVEFIALEQTVAPGANLIFTATIPRRGVYGVRQREGSGLIEFRPVQCRGAALARFSGNISIPTGGTAGEITAAIALNGEALASSEMAVTPAAVENRFNVSAQAVVWDVGCGDTITVRNTSDQDITLGGNLIIE